MDLVKLNNEICGMRPYARQSIVHVIHHLTRKAAEFRKRNGPEDKIADHRKKAEKYMQEALIDKVLVPDEVIKFSLQFDASTYDKVLSDVTIPLSSKAFARIAAHQSMVKAVREFREKYPDWNKWLGESLEKLGTGSRFGTKMKNGRVKAHLQQRQRVEEAIDTIRRAQMAWLHSSGKNKIKVRSKEKEKLTEEKGEDTKNNKNEKDSNESESKDNIAAENTRSRFQNNKDNLESSNDSESEDSSATPADTSITKPSTVSKQSEKADTDKSNYSAKKLIPVVYEEVDENDSESEQELEEERSRTKLKGTTDKKKSKNKKLALVNNEDSEVEENEHSENIENESSDDRQMLDDKMEDSHEGDSTTDDSESSSDSEINDEINEKRAKKLLKKEKKRQKQIIPRSREVEVCKFSDLLIKEKTRKIAESDESTDSGDDYNAAKSPEKGVDPFFMTKSHDLLRIATAKRETKPEGPDRKGPKWGIEGSENWTGTRQERRARARRMMGIPDPEGFARRRGPPKLNSPSYPKQRGNIHAAFPLPSLNNIPPVSEKQEELHPSWAAKRKMNIASVGFQGKKVKFDDSD